jgi:hypothetical protein
MYIGASRQNISLKCRLPCPIRNLVTDMASTTLQQERRELWETILDEVRNPDPDPARTAACSYLLHHLVRSHTARAAWQPERGDTGIGIPTPRFRPCASPRRLQIHRHDFLEDVLR